MYRERLVTPLLREALKSFPAVLVTGPRQSGKTTLLRHLLDSTHDYVLLDELDVRTLAQGDPRSFFERHPKPVFLDEIQNVPALLPYMKAQIDRDRRPGQWVLSGSQQFAMMKNVSESLAGRIAILSLHPFSIRECFHSRAKPFSFAGYVQSLWAGKELPAITAGSVGEWLLRGAYPEVWQNKEISRNLWYSSYVQTYLDRDVRGNVKEANLYDFGRFLKLLAARTAQELNLASLSRELGISIPTVRSWISLLEASSLVFLLPPYHRNFGKRLIKSPKLYFMDTGLVSYLVGLQTAEHLLQSPMAGSLFETAIIANFKKMADFSGAASSLFFWRSIGELESDLVIDLAGELYPAEIKLSSTITPHHYSGLTAWRKLANPQADGLLINTGAEVGRIGPQTRNVHWSQL